MHKIWIRFLADLAEKMDSPEMVESNGKTLLDNSIVFHSSDMATGLHSFKAGDGAWNDRGSGTYCRGMPYLYLGDSGCGLKTNEHFVLDGVNADQTNFSHGELLMTFARQCGVSAQTLPSFGDQALCEKVVSPIIP